MSYAAVDSVIARWARRHALQLVTSVAGVEEVRNVYLSSTVGDCFQVWVEVPSGDQVAVHAACVEGPMEDDPPRDWSVPIDQLDDGLEEALRTVVAWMKPAERSTIGVGSALPSRG